MFDTKTDNARLGQRKTDSTIILQGQGLTIDDVVQVARFGTRVELTGVKEVLQRVETAHDYITEAAPQRRTGHDKRDVRDERHCRQLCT